MPLGHRVFIANSINNNHDSVAYKFDLTAKAIYSLVTKFVNRILLFDREIDSRSFHGETVVVLRRHGGRVARFFRFGTDMAG